MRTSWFVPTFAVALALATTDCKKPAPSAGTGAPSASAEPEQTGVKFKRKLPTAGTVSLIDNAFEMRLEMKGGKGGQKTVLNRETHKRKRSVGRVNDRFVTQVSVEYLDQKSEEEEDGKKKEVPSKLKGKKYVVEWDGAGSVVSYEGGGRVNDAEERELVAENEWDVGKHGDLAAFIPDRPLKVGESFDADEAALRALLGIEKEDKVTVEKATFTFSGTRPEGGKTYGLFDAKLAVNAWSKAWDLTFVFEVNGKLSVELETAWLKDVSLEGPVKVKSDKSKDRPAEVEGTGTVKVSSFVKYD